MLNVSFNSCLNVSVTRDREFSLNFLQKMTLISKKKKKKRLRKSQIQMPTFTCNLHLRNKDL